MATQPRKSITNGPSTWDLIIEGLKQGKEIEFTFEGLGRKQVRITSVANEGGHDRWLIAGHVRIEGWRTRAFTGYYNGEDRTGSYDLELVLSACT